LFSGHHEVFNRKEENKPAIYRISTESAVGHTHALHPHFEIDWTDHMKVQRKFVEFLAIFEINKKHDENISKNYVEDIQNLRRPNSLLTYFNTMPSFI